MKKTLVLAIVGVVLMVGYIWGGSTYARIGRERLVELRNRK